jgi:hypothetical protein
LISNIYAIDIFLSSINPANRIEKGTYSTSGSFPITDMGTAIESTEIHGETMAVVPAGMNSRAFYIGLIGSATGTRRYLYERFGNATNAPYNYRAFGDSDFNSIGYFDYFAEGKISTWKGAMAASMIQRGFEADGVTPACAKIFMIYSGDEGKTLNPPAAVPMFSDAAGTTCTNDSHCTPNQACVNGRCGIPFEYGSDPTAVVTDNRTIFSVQIGVHFGNVNKKNLVCAGETASNVTKSVIYAVSTTASSFPTFSSTPLVLQTRSGAGADHPYADIQHVGGAADLIHVAWNNPLGGTAPGINYVAFNEDATQGQIVVRTLSATESAPVRVTASDSGRVIVYWKGGLGARFCEINAARDGCLGVIHTAPFLPTDVHVHASASPNDPAFIQTAAPFSMAVSESGDKLYYCFQQLESNGDGNGDGWEEADVYCVTGTRDPSTFLWSWPQTAVGIGSTNDNKDQFLPEVVLTQEQGTYSSVGETPIVTYYDRSDDPANVHYNVKKTVSTDRGVSYATPRVQFGGVTADPGNLPRHPLEPWHPDARFAGDYSGAEGDVLHATSLSVLSYTPNTIGSTVFGNFNSLGHWNQ